MRNKPTNGQIRAIITMLEQQPCWLTLESRFEVIREAGLGFVIPHVHLEDTPHIAAASWMYWIVDSLPEKQVHDFLQTVADRQHAAIAERRRVTVTEVKE